MSEISRAFQIVAEAPDGLSDEELQRHYDEACGEDAELRETVAKLDASLRAAAAADFMEHSTVLCPRAEAPGTLLGDGKYKLLQQIGEGGFGIVYMAEQLGDLKRRVAIKIVKPGMDSRQVIARFEAERQALARMEHPNIAKVFEAGATENGRPYFVMELVNGWPITTFCEERKLDKAQRLALFIDVCHAVQHAHQKGVIHRDIKPSNVMITMHDDKAVPKVIDFGVAKATQGELTDKTLFTRYEQLIGTPAYMSPEQAQMSGLDIDTRSDIYALGVLLYELLTGTTPFSRETLHSAGWDEIRRIIREEDPPKPSTRMRTITLARVASDRRQISESALRGDLDWIVMKAIEKDRVRRYDTANGLAADVQRHLADEPVLAAAPSPGYRLRKFVRKHRPAIAVTGAIGSILLIGSVVSTWLALAATSAKRAEKEVSIKAQRDERSSRHRLAEELFTAGHSDVAVAHLVNLARDEDPVAMERLISALVYRDFPERIAQVNAPDHHTRIGEEARFIGDDEILLPVPAYGKLAIWNAQVGSARWLSEEGDSWTDHPAISPDGSVAAIQMGGQVNVYSTDQLPPDNLLLTLEISEALGKEWDGKIWSMCFDETGSMLLAAGDQGLALAWDLKSGKPCKPHRGHSIVLYSAALHPDGKRALTGGLNAHLWDVESGELLATLFHGERIWSVAFSPDGRYAATASGDGTAQIWSVPPGGTVERRGPPLTHDGRVKHVVFSPDSALIATSSEDKTACIWDVESGRMLHSPLQHASFVLKSRFDMSGTRLATSSYSGQTRVWDVGTGRPVGAPLRHSQPSTSASFDQSGDRLLTTSLSEGATLWKAPRARPASLVFWHGEDRSELHYGSKISFARFCEGGSTLLTAHRFLGVRLWDAHTGESIALQEDKVNYGGYEPWAALTSDGQTLIVTRRIQFPALLCHRSGGSFERNRLDVRGSSYTEISPDETMFLISGQEHATRLFRLGTGDLVGDPLEDERSNARADSLTRTYQARFSPDSRRIVTPSGSTGLRIWDGDTLTPQRKLQLSAVIEHIDFHPDPASRLLVTGASDGSVLLWDTDSGDQLIASPPRHSDAVKFVKFSPDGESILSASGDGTARIWDSKNGSLLVTMHHDSTVTMAVFSPDGRRVATASYDHTARVWDAQTGLPVSEPLRHDGWVYSLEFNADGTRLATAGFDGAAKIWDLPTVPLPAPPWFLEWCEAVVEKRIGAGGVVAPVDWDEARVIRTKVAAERRDGFYGKLAEWYSSAISERTITPFSELTLEQYVANALEANTLASLEEAVRVDPKNATAYARLMEFLDARSAQGDLERANYAARLAGRFGTGEIVARIPPRPRPPATDSENNVLVPPTARWRWFHPTDHTDPAESDPDFHQTFASPDFDDSTWSTGIDSDEPTGGFGYGNDWHKGIDIGTPETSTEEDGRAPLSSAYFRHRFSTDRHHEFLELRCQYDDGIIVYLDGVEVGRDNMPECEEAFDLAALEPVRRERVIRRIPLTVPGGLSPGEHVLAISLHNESPNGSDLHIGGITLVE